MGRPSKKDIVLKNLDKIEQWSSEGLFLHEIADKLGVSASTLQKYKSGSKEIEDSIAKGRKPAVKNMEAIAYKSACGSERIVTRHTKIKKIEYWENGKKKKEWEEIAEYEELEITEPNMAALIFLLKNWAKYANEPQIIGLRKKEYELKKQQADSEW